MSFHKYIFLSFFHSPWNFPHIHPSWQIYKSRPYVWKVSWWFQSQCCLEPGKVHVATWFINFLYGEIKLIAPSDVKILSDLADHKFTNFVIPQDILMSNGSGSKPDITVISRSNEDCIVWAHTPTGMKYSHYKHLQKFSGMRRDLVDKGWKVHLVPYEVNSRGQILKSTKGLIITTLKQFKIKIKAEQL